MLFILERKEKRDEKSSKNNMLDFIWDGFVTWLVSKVASVLDVFAVGILEMFSPSLDVFLKYVPFANEATYVIVMTSYSFVFLAIVLKLVINMFAIFNDGQHFESVSSLIFRAIVCLVLIWQHIRIVTKILEVFQVPYRSLLELSIAGEKSLDLASGIFTAICSGLNSSLTGSSIVNSIVALIIIFAIATNYFKLLLEIVERYVIMGLICYFSPFGISMFATKGTENVFFAYGRMLGSELILMLMNVWFLKSVHSTMANYNAHADSFIIWAIIVISLLRAGQKIDSYLMTLGLNTATTGTNLSSALVGAGGTMLGAAKSAGRMARNGFTGSHSPFSGSNKTNPTNQNATGFAQSTINKMSPSQAAESMGQFAMAGKEGANIVSKAFGSEQLNGAEVLDATTMGNNNGRSSADAPIQATLKNPDGSITDTLITSDIPLDRGYKEITDANGNTKYLSVNPNGLNKNTPLGGYAFSGKGDLSDQFSSKQANALGLGQMYNNANLVNKGNGYLGVYDKNNGNYLGGLTCDVADTNRKSLGIGDKGKDNFGNNWSFTPNAKSIDELSDAYKTMNNDIISDSKNNRISSGDGISGNVSAGNYTYDSGEMYNSLSDAGTISKDEPTGINEIDGSKLSFDDSGNAIGSLGVRLGNNDSFDINSDNAKNLTGKEFGDFINSTVGKSGIISDVNTQPVSDMSNFNDMFPNYKNDTMQTPVSYRMTADDGVIAVKNADGSSTLLADSSKYHVSEGVNYQNFKDKYDANVLAMTVDCKPENTQSYKSSSGKLITDSDNKQLYATQSYAKGKFYSKNIGVSTQNRNARTLVESEIKGNK